MSLSVRTRFEVFKRDRFTCSYCGRTPPEILLEVDHVIPRAAGGSDDITNLTTACATCNSGKSARLLEEGTAPVVGRATVQELAERVEQAKAYMELLGGLESVVDRQIQMVFDSWGKAFGATAVERDDGTFWHLTGYDPWPGEPSLRRVLRSLTLQDVLTAVDIAAAKMNARPGIDAVRYFFGVCHRSIREGRSPGTGPAPTAGDDGHLFDLGHAEGRKEENAAIGEVFRNYQNHGYATLADVVAALWPED